MLPIGKLLEPIYNGYKSTSKYIWDLMGRSYRLQISVREETVTEMALMHLKELLQSKIHVEKYTPTEEKKLGSDWEWLIVEGDRAIEFRVQAKRLYVRENSLRYDQLHYENGQQTKSLIENARMEGKIPLYCFFNYIPDGHLEKLKFPKPGPSTTWQSLIPSMSPDYDSLGWTFTYAEHIWDSPRTTRFKIIGPLSQGIDFFNRDLEDIINEYNALYGDDDQGDGGSKVGPDDHPNPGGSDGSSVPTGAPHRKLEVEKRDLRVKSVSEDLKPYQKALLKKLGIYHGDVGDHEPPDHIAMTVVTIIEYNSESSGNEPIIPHHAPLSSPEEEEDVIELESAEQQLERRRQSVMTFGPLVRV